MTISLVNVGSSASGSSSLTVNYPASISAGNMLLLVIVNKYPTNGPSTPSGWTLLDQQSGGAGAAGADSGEVYTTVYWKEADGTESGSVSVTITSGNSSSGRILNLSRTGSAWDTLVAGKGADTTSGTAFSVTTGSVNLAAGDYIIACAGVNANSGGGSIGFSGQALSASGITFGTVNETVDYGTANGEDHSAGISDAAVSSGSGTAAITASWTLGGNGAGAAVVVRLREVTGSSGSVAPSAATIGFSALAPTVVGNQSGSVAPPAATIAFSALAPVVSGAQSGSVAPPAATIAFSALAPVVSGAQSGSVAPPTATIAFTALAPTVTADGSSSGAVAPPAAAIALVALAPVVSGAQSGSVAPPTATIAFTALAPTVTGVQGGTGTGSEGGGGLAADGYYYFANSLDLGEVYTSRLSAAITAQGVNIGAEFFDAEDVFAAGDFFGFDSTGWAVVLEQRVSNDAAADPEAAWSDWQEFQASDYSARSFQWRLFLGRSEAGISPLVTALAVTVDMPDRTIAENALAVPLEGLRVDFDPPYLALKGIGFAIQDLAAGDYHRVSYQDETGFHIRFFDADDTPIERSFSYVAVGYGRRVVLEL